MTPRPAPHRLASAVNAETHPDWCAQGHRCGLGEHRADPLAIDVPRLGRIVLTRVQSSDGRQQAEIRATVVLAEAERHARAQLLTLTTDLVTLLHRANARPSRRVA